VYATAEAVNYYGSIADGVYEDETGKTMYLVSKHSDKPTLILGVPSHFYAYEGNEVSFKNPLLLTDIGFQVNDQSLLKSIRVSFSKSVGYNFGVNPLLKKIASIACACGPYSGYSDVGGSDLVFSEEKDGISWYRLTTPVYVDSSVSNMQIYYLPNGKEGVLSLAIADMIFLVQEGEQGKYIRATVLPEPNMYVGAEHALIPTEGKVINQYEAYLADAEKGVITFREVNGAISIVFENKGDDVITVDDDSYTQIQRALAWSINAFAIRNNSGEIVKSLSLYDIYRNHLLSKSIRSGESISVPLIQSSQLQLGAEYTLLANVGERVYNTSSVRGTKISHWIVGDNPYYRPGKTEENIVPLYRIQKNQTGTVIFNKFE
jgi:hypothetical protein